jgi:hypothetical protein
MRPLRRQFSVVKVGQLIVWRQLIFPVLLIVARQFKRINNYERVRRGGRWSLSRSLIIPFDSATASASTGCRNEARDARTGRSALSHI